MGLLKTLLLRVLLKIAWSVGGHADHIDGLPRITASGAEPWLSALHPGDLVLLGNNGRLTHVAVHAGAGDIVHAMATEKTMLGWWGSLRDAIKRFLGAGEQNVGVVRESLAAFLDRFERDTVVVVRTPNLTPETVQRALSLLQSLVGQPYDYGFRTDNASWYCTELAQLYLDETLGKGAAPIPPKRVRVPLLLDEDVLEPEAILAVPGLTAVLANGAARVHYAKHLEGATIAE